MILQAVVGGFVLDALFGDPAWLPHPVVLMGRCISRLEKFLRARLPGTPQGELLGGAVTAFCLPVGTFLVTSLVCLAAAKLSPWLGLAVQMFWCGQALAAKGLGVALKPPRNTSTSFHPKVSAAQAQQWRATFSDAVTRCRDWR